MVIFRFTKALVGPKVPISYQCRDGDADQRNDDYWRTWFYTHLKKGSVQDITPSSFLNSSRGLTGQGNKSLCHTETQFTDEWELKNLKKTYVPQLGGSVEDSVVEWEINRHKQWQQCSDAGCGWSTIRSDGAVNLVVCHLFVMWK